MKVAIVGAGLGGLLTGASLVRDNHEVDIFERLPIYGGRFTNIDCKGFKLSTGALHMVPHGPGGPLAKLLRDVGADVEIVRCNPMAVIRVPASRKDDNYYKGYKDIPFNNFGTQFSLWNRIKLFFLLATTKRNPPTGVTFEEWINRNLNESNARKIADSFCGWALSLRSKDVPVEEAFSIVRNLYQYGGTGVPIGGCKGISDALADVIRENGGKLHLKSEVEEILVENGTATGVIVDGKEYLADLVISDIGHLQTSQLCKNSDLNEDYVKNVKDIKSSAGVKICLGANEPLIGHSGVLLTPFCRRVNGINEVTNIDPGLAPPGKHLVMAHQCVSWDRLGNLEEEINMGLKDLEELFAGKDYEVLLVQSYHNGWPVNRAASGSDPGNKTPVENLFVVGDGAKEEGGIEIEGIALGVMNTLKLLQ
ncbi:NAD(P)/FAD-dependent oxidoreductase [Methanohalophilus sp.]|uniref:phytoene desaturase family protein n=1 Tax=Methanohalophilus sp. TaxID=1966352 RepID=UPI00262A132C|nr:NAD(P)/FAD-dependent oxidoreductase [Methanohalophilus sp.]MDK2892625.1 hypothetical protein [Methanohalophilus sp.]